MGKKTKDKMGTKAKMTFNVGIYYSSYSNCFSKFLLTCVAFILIWFLKGTNMLLVIDVGNSNNVIGLFSGKKLLTHWRIRTEWNRTADEYWVLIKEFILLILQVYQF